MAAGPGVAMALAGLALALAATDPDRAERIAADAEGVAQSIIREDRKAAVLAGLAQALAVIALPGR